LWDFVRWNEARAQYQLKELAPLHVFRLHRGFTDPVLIAAGIALLSSCQGVSPGNFNTGSTLVASPSTLSFGSEQKSKSSNLSETLTNTGGRAITISEVNITGAAFFVGKTDIADDTLP
jgi:hypothetical protein